ncbi:MAG: hypothetical protein JJE55_05590 [Flavobacteriaceae bacterium]|nr:hypothetical protein [Flavobacteriaceae bacterium]
MKKSTFILLFIILSAKSIYAQTTYQYDKNENLIYYENIIQFSEKDKTELIEKFEKFCQVNKMPIIYKDENEMYTIGEKELAYKSHFLIFYNNKTKDVIYDLQLSFKDNKVKYKAYNFYIVPKKINIYSIGSAGAIGNGGFIGSSVTRIPREIPKEPLENLYRIGKNHKRFKIFQDLDKQMEDFESTLKIFMETEDDNW